MKNLTEIKSALYAQCLAYVAQRIDNAKKAMEAAQEAANEESKSSAGDKYETGRAMMQLERDRHAAQLSEALTLKKHLDQIRIEKNCGTVQPGSLVLTSQGNFFMAISRGKILIDGKEYFAVSLASPIGTKLSGLKEGDALVFNHKTLRIEKVM